VIVLGMRLLSGLFGGLSLFWTFWTEIEEAEERSIDAVSGVIILYILRKRGNRLCS
jgi:hypothetical protein